MSSNGLHSKSDNHSTLSSSSASPPTLSCASSSSTTTTTTTASTATSTTQNIKLNNNLKLSHFNNQFKCSLCLGYIINATTINECLDSFCRSCIVKHFNDNHDCPKCGLKLNETRKWETLRMDSILQSFIYKLVPGLFRSELKLRKEFHSKSNVSPCDYYDEQKDYYQLTDKISVLLMYSKYSNDKSKKSSNGKKMIGSDKTSTTSSSSDEHRYLLCPAGFPIGSLKKFICLKYELSSCFKVDIMFDDKILDDDLQLLDIVYIYSTQQPIPLHFKLNNFAVHKNNQTTTTSKSQINVIKKSVNNHQLSSPTSTSLTSSSSSSTKTSTSASTVTQSSPHFHMKTTTTTTSTASTNTPNNGNAKNDVKNDNTTLKSVAVQSSSVITCATSPMNPVSSSTSTVAPTRNSPSLSSQNIDKNQLEKSQLMNEREKQAMHSVSSSIKSSDTKRVIKPKVINTKLAPMVNQINLKRSTTSVLPCSTQVTTVTLNKQSKPSSVKTNKQSNMFVKSVELTNRETDKRFINGYDNIGFTPISCSQSTPKVTSTNTVSSTPSVSITATTMITTTSHGAKNNFISKHLSQMNNESEKRKESDCKSDKSEAPRKQMKVSQVNDKINSQLSVTSSNQNDSSKSPSAPTSPKASSTQINTIDKTASNNVVNKITRDVNENCKTSHSVGTSISPNNSQTSVNAPKSVPSSVITAGNSNVSNSKSNNNQSTNSEVKSNGIKVDDKVVKSSNAIKAPSVSSSQSSTVTSKSLSSSSSSSSPHLVIAPSPSPSTSSSSPSPKLSSTSTSVTSSKPSTISTSTSSSSSCTSTSTPTSTKVVSSSFYPTSTSTSTSISRLMNNQQQKVKQSGQGDKRQRESPSSSSPGNAPDNRPSKMVKISKNQTLNSQHKNLQIQHQQQQQQQKQQHQQLQQQYKLHQQMIGNHDQLTNDSVFNVKALIADEKEAALNKNSPQTGFTLKSMPVDLRNPRNMNKSGGLHAIPSGPFQHFHHFANPSSVLVPIATGSSGHSPGPYHESSFPHLKYLEYTKFMGEALMQHFQQANNASFGINLNLNGNINGNVNGNVNVNGKSITNTEGERVKGFYKETLCNSPNRENGTKNDKN